MGRDILDFNNYQLTVIMKVIHSILSFSPSIALSQDHMYGGVRGR